MFANVLNVKGPVQGLLWQRNAGNEDEISEKLFPEIL
jgi:hypothetical protein